MHPVFRGGQGLPIPPSFTFENSRSFAKFAYSHLLSTLSPQPSTLNPQHLSDDKIGELCLGQFQNGLVTALDILSDGIDEIFALVGPGDFEWEIQQVRHLTRFRPLIQPLGIARDADVQRRVDVDPYEALSQDFGDCIALGMLRGHGGDDDVHPLLCREPGDFGNAPMIFDARFAGKFQVGTKSGPHIVAIEEEDGDTAVNESVF